MAFAPSFAFVIAGGPHLDRLRDNVRAQAFLTGVGPAAIGAIGGAAVPLALALSHAWQVVVLALAFGWVVGLRRSVVAAFRRSRGASAWWPRWRALPVGH